MPWSFSFLRKFSYASATFALFTACVSIQFGTVMMQFVDRVHCVFLKSLLTSPQFPISDAILARLGLKDYQYKCQIQIPPVEVQDDFGMRQLRQGCYCRMWDEMSANKTLITYMPLVAAQTLLVTGHHNFDTFSFAFSFQNIIDGMYATLPTLISFGVLVGKMAPAQNVVLAFMNVLFYAFNYWVCIYLIGAFDGTGGAVTTHVFGAFFGAACAAVATPEGAESDPDSQGRYQSEILSLFGSLMMWAYYPSYNSFYAPSTTQQTVAVNTYLALLGSSIAGLSASAIFNGNLKLTVFDAQRSCIAGGVAMGSVANLLATPWQATLIGACGGVVCSFSGHFIRLFCVERLGIHDTVGVMSMHGFPGLVGWLAGVFMLLPLNDDILKGDLQNNYLTYEVPWSAVLQHRNGNGDAAFYQAVIAPMTISIALVTGMIAGTIANKVTTIEKRYMYKDNTFFQVPEDFQTQEEHIADIHMQEEEDEGDEAFL
mmetsp:Transcript_2553/g.8399  ORF Transcript_2553/g.8399 Transcript_2553/m.8399 type:complete len:485 (-) Transcript_2553:1097-2551(-)